MTAPGGGEGDALRILYVCADKGVPLLGSKGASVHARSITGALAALGHSVTVAVRRLGSGNPPPPVDHVAEIGPSGGDTARQLDALIRAQGVDVVVERYSLESGPARAASHRHGVPLVLEVNAPLVAEARRFRGLDDDTADGREVATLAGADHVQVVSRALLRHVGAVAPEVPCTWIPNGADVERFHRAVPERLPGTGDRLAVGFVGSMKPWHGVDVLVEAVADLRRRGADLQLLLVGGGPQEEALRARVGASGLGDSVRMLGAVPHARVPGLVRGLDVAVAPYAPSDDFYFSPLKVMEYLAGGVPVVYSDLGDLPAVVGDAGVAVPAGDPGALADAIATLAADPARRARCARAALARSRGFGWDTTAARLVEVCRRQMASLVS